jgi:hypothetical protein
MGFLKDIQNATRKALGLARQKRQEKPENVENVVPNTRKNANKDNKRLPKGEMNAAILKRRGNRIPSALKKPSMPPKDKKPKLGFAEQNSEGVKLPNNKNTRGLVGNVPTSTVNPNRYRLNRSRRLQPSNGSPAIISKSAIQTLHNQQVKNTSPANRFSRNVRMPNAEIIDQMASRKGFSYTPEEILEMSAKNLVRLPKDHWRYAYNLLQKNPTVPNYNSKLTALEDRVAGFITNANLNAENFPEGNP